MEKIVNLVYKNFFTLSIYLCYNINISVTIQCFGYIRFEILIYYIKNSVLQTYLIQYSSKCIVKIINMSNSFFI